MEKREREKKKDLSPTREKVVVSLEKGVVVVGGLSRAAKKKSSSFLVRNTSTTFPLAPGKRRRKGERETQEARRKIIHVHVSQTEIREGEGSFYPVVWFVCFVSRYVSW